MARLRYSVLRLGRHPVRLVEHQTHGASSIHAELDRARVSRAQRVQIVRHRLQHGADLLLREGYLSRRVAALARHRIFLARDQARPHLTHALLVVLKHLLAA